ncbi:MAG: DHH family phosphoesterase [Nanoarchaeota archaeon]
MDYIEKFKDFINNIKESDNIAIFYHSMCTDGLCSCIITSKAINKIKNFKVKFHYEYKFYEVNDSCIEFVKNNNIKKCIFVDLSLDAKIDKLKKLEKYSEVLVIDHHKFSVDFNSNKTLFIHSEFINKDLDGSKYPASKLCYDLFSKMINVVEFDWLSAVGLVSDMGYKSWAYFVIDVQNKYHLNKDDDPYRTEIGKTAALIKLSKETDEDIDITFDIVYNSNSIFDVLNNKVLLDYKKKSEEELNIWINKRNNVEVHGDLVIYEISPRYKINSTLSTILSFQYFPNKTVILIVSNDDKDIIEINARDQRGIIKLNEFLRDLVQDLPNSTAGGHIPAAGARIRKEDLKIFKKRLIEKYNDIKK